MSSSDVQVRLFQPGDAGDFRRLNEEWITRYFRLEEKDREVLEHPEAILQAGGSILIATSDDGAIGCCALLPLPEGSTEVAKMAVTESYQGRGIGRLLLAATIAEARRMGVRRLYLETNSKLGPAIHLYESLGFRHLAPERVTPSPYERADVFMEMFLE